MQFRLKSNLAVYLFWGKKGNGKSLSFARLALMLFREYELNEKYYPGLPVRAIYSNQKLSKEIEDVQLEKGHLYYWSNAKQLRWCPRWEVDKKCFRNCDKKKCSLGNEPHGIHDKHPVHDMDIMHDEVGKDLPAGSWADTPKWFKQTFSHLRKRGNRYYANTQVFEDIDISFRRQIDFAYQLHKSFGSGDITATRPPPKRVWGLVQMREFDPELVEWERDPSKRDRKREDSSWKPPVLILITRKLVSVYDTKDELPPYKADEMEHVNIWCEDDHCEKHGRIAGKPKVEHYKI